MKLKTTKELVIVTLSKRNVLSLLHKVDTSWSSKTILKETKGERKLVVIVEDDKTHYENRPDGPPGPMHYQTEAFIAINQET